MGKDHTEGAQWLGVGDVARLCDVHRNTVHNWIKSGRLEAHKVVENDRDVYRINEESLINVRPEAPRRNLDAQRPTDAQELAEALGQRLQGIVQAHQQELGDLREELGREKQRREELEARLQEYEHAGATEATEEAEGVSEGVDREGSWETSTEAESAGEQERVPWWRRLFGKG